MFGRSSDLCEMDFYYYYYYIYHALYTQIYTVILYTYAIAGKGVYIRMSNTGDQHPYYV